MSNYNLLSLRSRMTIRFLIMALLLVGHSACVPAGNWDLSSAPTLSKLSSDDSASGAAPMDVEIKSAKRENDILKVEVVLRPRTSLDSDDVAVALYGLNGRTVLEKQSSKLDQLVGKMHLKKGQEVDVEFALAAENLTDYEVKCSWGSDAQALAGSPQAKPIQEEIADEYESTALNVASSEVGAHSQASKKSSDARVYEEISRKELTASSTDSATISLKNVKRSKRVLECAKPPCDYHYVIDAVVENKLAQEVSGIAFGIGIFWEADGQGLSDLPQDGDPLDSNEEVLRQKSFRLAPGEKKKIKVEVDRAIPEVPGGQFIANLRILDYS